jgi:carboxymethylenebutenolidase
MRIDLPSGTPAELALPPGSPTRGVVLFPDIFGLRPLFDDLAARLAAEHGWAVCVVEPFPGRDLPDIDERFAAVPELEDDRLVGDARAAAAELAKHGSGPIAVMGFCMGGMYVYKAARPGTFDRAVSFYGMIRLPAAWKGPGQGEPITALEGATGVPVLAIVGELDPYTPPEDVAALQALGPQISVVRYPSAEHGFVHDPERPAHRAEDAADAWRRVVGFLSVNGAAAAPGP